MKTLIILRHGLTRANKEGRYCGHLDLPLIDEGKTILKENRPFVEKENIQRIITSPLLRAVETTDILFPDRTIEIENALKEINFGIFEGLGYQEISEKYPAEAKRWASDFLNYTFPEGESFKEFSNRVAAYMADFLEKHLDSPEETVVMCTHLGVIQCLLIYLLKLDNSMLWRFKVRNGYYLKVGFDDKGFGYLTW